MQEQSTQNNDNRKDPTHELWLIYCQLKHAKPNRKLASSLSAQRDTGWAEY